MVLRYKSILFFALTSLHNFTKDYSLQDINYFEVENEDSNIQSGRSDNLLLGYFLVTFIQTNKKIDIIANII